MKRYKERFDHCDVPQGWSEDPQLGSWVARQRNKHDAGRLSSEHKDRLDALGFDWNPINSVWEKNFAELQRFKDEYGDCNVPQKWKTNPQLAEWVVTQRGRRKKGTLSSTHRARLDVLEFDWHPRNSAWEKMFAELQRYKERFRDCNVPEGWPENPRLGRWVSFHRELRNAGKVLPVRKARLDELGFDWEPRANKRRPAAE